MMLTRRCLSLASRATISTSTQSLRTATIASAAPSLSRRWLSSSSTSTSTSTSTSSSSSSSSPSSSPSSSSADPQYRDAYEQVSKNIVIIGNFPDVGTIAPFGTLQYPSLIYSAFRSRIVGCVGGENLKHRLLWFNLKEGRKHVCSECGQVFKLVTDHNFHEVEHYADERTQQHFKYYKTLAASGQKPGSEGTNH